MARKTVEAVVQAELSAEQLEKDTIIKCEELINKAKLDADRLISDMIKKALADSKENLDKAVRLGEEAVQSAKNETEKEIENLSEIAAAKKKAAKELVFKNII